MENRMIRESLGRFGALGDLYNARTEKLCGHSIFKESLPTTSTAISSQEIPFSDYNFTIEDSTSDKLNSMKLSAEIKASFMGGLITLEGSGKYLQDEKLSSRSARSTLTYTMTTKNERVNLTNMELRPIIDMLALQNDNDQNDNSASATHVISEIKWGGTLHVVINYKNEEGDDTHEIGGSLLAHLQKLSLSVSGKANVDLIERGRFKREQFSMRIYGDVVLGEKAPKTIEKAISLVQLMPALVKEANGGKGVPVQFVLLPLDQLRPHFNLTRRINSVIQSLEESSIIQFMDVFDQILRAKQNLQDFLSDMQQQEKFLKTESVSYARRIKSDLEFEEAKLKAKLGETLVAVRQGKQPSSVMFDLLADFKANPMSPDKVQLLLDTKFDEELEKIALVQAIKKAGAHVLQRGQTLDQFILETNSKSFVLFYSKTNSDQLASERWTKNRHLFLTLIRQNSGQGKPGANIKHQNIIFKKNVVCPAKFPLKSTDQWYTISVFGKQEPDFKLFCLELLDDEGTSILRAQFDSATKQLTLESSGCTKQQILLEMNSIFQFSVSQQVDGFQIFLDEEENSSIFYKSSVKSSSENLSLSIKGDVNIVLLKVDIVEREGDGNGEMEGETAALNPFEQADGTKKINFVFVDCDVLPGLRPKEGVNIIQEFEEGQILSRDLYADQAASSSKRLAKCSSPPKIGYKPNKRALVALRCPGSISGRCKNDVLPWLCFKCEEQLEFGFDGFFYCSCGKGKAADFLYRCADTAAHGSAFQKFSQNDLDFQLKKIRPFKELNILILGETGVGKSTFINGFANYLTHQTLDEAMGADLVSLIPSSFPVYDDTWKEVTVVTGKDANENQKAGQSGTQSPRTYSFLLGSTLVQVIDTPGIGDTRGIEYDKKNMENIMRHLGFFEEIHGICLLFQPNQDRITSQFKFCFKELLAHLHRDAVDNMTFCFTNARSTLYQPAGTFKALNLMLEENKKIDPNSPNIVLAKDTVYQVDNEAFRFLAAHKQKVPFSKEHQKLYSDSWDLAARETNRLLHHFKECRPHSVNDTVSLNDTRQTILLLSRPIALISDIIQSNIELISRKKEAVKKNKTWNAELARDLYIPYIDLEKIQLDHPKTVCASAKCVKTIQISEESASEKTFKTEYQTVCHSHCKLDGVPTDVLQCAALQGCGAMDNGNCKGCGCPWYAHMHITYDTRQVQRRMENKNVRNQLRDHEEAAQTILEFLHNLENEVEALKEEQQIILKTAAKFAAFLQDNAMTPYNDAFIPHLDNLIDQEEKHAAKDGKSRRRLENLRQLRSDYAVKVEALKKEVKKAALYSDSKTKVSAVSTKEANELLHKLYKLPINGPKIKGLMEFVRKSHVDLASPRSYCLNLTGGNNNTQQTSGKQKKEDWLYENWKAFW